MSVANFVTDLGMWPKDYARQLEFFHRLKMLLQQANTFVTNNVGLIVLLEQASEPSQTEWESAWTDQTGLPTPIPMSAQLYWWDTSVNAFGGQYGTVEGSTTVYRRDHLYPRGAAIINETAYKTDKIASLTYAIGANLTDHPAISFTLPTRADIYMEYLLFVKLASGSGQWGADFLINGIKAGTQYLSLAANQGIQNAMATGQLRAFFTLSDAEPGDYTIQAIFGVTGSPASPPTLTIGGLSGSDSYGVRSLIVRGYAK